MDNLDSFNERPISYTQNLFDDDENELDDEDNDDNDDNDDNEDQQSTTRGLEFDMSGFNMFNDVIETTMKQPIHSYDNDININNDNDNDEDDNINNNNYDGVNDDINDILALTNEEKELNERARSMVAQLMNKSNTINKSTRLQDMNELEEAIEEQRREEKKILEQKKISNNNNNNNNEKPLRHESRPKSPEVQQPKGQTPYFPRPKEQPLQSNHIINFETSPYAQPMGFKITSQETSSSHGRLKPEIPLLKTNHFPSAPSTPSFNYDNRVFYGESKEYENPLGSTQNNPYTNIVTPQLNERDPYTSVCHKKQIIEQEEVDTQRSIESISSLGSLGIEEYKSSSKTPFKENSWPLMPHVDQHIRNNQLTMINLTKTNTNKVKKKSPKSKRRQERKKSVFTNIIVPEDDDSTIASEATIFKESDIFKGDESSSGFTEVDIRMMMVFIHSTCSGRMNSDPIVEAKRLIKDKEMKYLGKDSLLEFELTLPDLIAAFRRYHQAIAYKKIEEQSREIMTSFIFLIEQNNLTPIEWFCLNDIKGGLGGNGRLTFSELKRGINNACLHLNLPEWSDSNLNIFKKYCDLNGDGDITEEEFLIAIDKYSKPPEFETLLNDAGPLFKVLEEVMTHKHIRVKDLFIMIDTDSSMTISLSELSIAVRKLLFWRARKLKNGKKLKSKLNVDTDLFSLGSHNSEFTQISSVGLQRMIAKEIKIEKSKSRKLEALNYLKIGKNEERWKEQHDIKSEMIAKMKKSAAAAVLGNNQLNSNEKSEFEFMVDDDLKEFINCDSDEDDKKNAKIKNKNIKIISQNILKPLPPPSVFSKKNEQLSLSKILSKLEKSPDRRKHRQLSVFESPISKKLSPQMLLLSPEELHHHENTAKNIIKLKEKQEKENEMNNDNKVIHLEPVIETNPNIIASETYLKPLLNQVKNLKSFNKNKRKLIKSASKYDEGLRRYDLFMTITKKNMDTYF